MRSALRAFLGPLILAAFGAGLASAQSAAFDFSLLVTENGITNTVTNNSAIPITAAIGSQATATVVATYIGSTAATITSPPTILVGSTEFTAKITATTTGSTALPIVLVAGQSVTFVVTYAPTVATQATAEVSLAYTEPGATNTTLQNSINLIFVGGAPSFVLSYILQPTNGTTGNVVQIAPGGTIPFPPTPLNTTTAAQLNITNEGSGAGTITAISLSDSPAFRLSGTPLFPFTLTTSAPNLAIGILYTPTAVETDTGTITITYQGGGTATVNLTGTGATSNYSYSYLAGGTTTPTPVSPNQTIVFTPAAVGTTTIQSDTTSVIVQVTNKGTVSGTITGISVQGTGFQLINPPSTVPTLLPGASTSFTIGFTPAKVGTQTGTLVVGSDVFTLSGQGLGPALTFAYNSSVGTIAVGVNGAVVFTPVAVSRSETLTFILTNSGTTSATVSNISTSSTNTPNPFSVTAPALPLVLAAGQSTQFPVTFTPAIVGTVTGSLLIDTTAVPMEGTGTTPPTLPSYTISGLSGTISPATQANLSLTLASPYPVDLNGVLTLTTSGNYGTDPSVQFATGSSTGNRTVDFSIPANSTSANFAGQGPDIPVQTGTVAETITLTPSFMTVNGVDLTPSSPTTLQFTVAAAAPVLESLQVTNTTASSFTLLITGYSTTRSLGSVNVTFTPAKGYTLSTSAFTIDVSQVAALWFQSASSVPFGGLFQITLPFNIPGQVPVNKTLIQAIASAAVTVTNSAGTSNSLSANLP